MKLVRFVVPMFAFCLILLTSLSSCSRGNREVNQSLERIEAVVGQYPDSALVELCRLDSLLSSGKLSLEGEAQRARYALLTTQTHDKNWIDDASDSLILIAVRYYDAHGSQREQMLAHYYHGAIFRNARDYGAAFVAYRQAESLALELEDSHYLSLIYGNLSSLSYETYSQDAIEYCQKSLKYARLSNNTRQAFHIMSKMAQIYTTQLVNDSAEYWYRNVLDSLPASDPIVQSCLTSYIEQCITNEKYQLADSLLNLLSPIEQPVDLLNKACLFQMKGMSDSADVYIRHAKEALLTPEQMIFYYEKLSWIAEMKGELSSAIEFYRARIKEENEVVTTIFSKSVSDYQRNFEQQQKEYVEYRYTQYKRRTILASAFFLLLMVGGVAFALLKRKEQQLVIDAYMENVSVLEQTLLENSGTIAILQNKVETIDSERLAKEVEHHNQIKTLFAKGFHDLDALCSQYYNCQGKIDEQRQIYKKVQKLIEDFVLPPQQEELERFIDSNFNHAIEKARSSQINLSEEELELFRYRVAGFSIRSICLLTHGNNREAIKKRIQRLKRKIIQSNSPSRDEIASLM